MKSESGSRFILTKDRMYHFPHNSALREEFDFMLRVLDPRVTGKKVHTFKEIYRKLIIEQVRQGCFEGFHPKPHAIFTTFPPPDMGTLLKKLGKRKANIVARARIRAYKKFVKNPEKHCDEFLAIQYKATKTWKQNWVEFVRDYADLAAYCGLLPAFFKNPFGDSPEDGYMSSERLMSYIKKELSFEDVLLGMKYSNSSINLERYPQFHIRVRPFYSALKILASLKDKGIRFVEFKLLGAAVACLRSEDEISEAADCISNEFALSYFAKFAHKPGVDKLFQREAGRFSLSLISFLKAAKLIKVSRMRGTKYVEITDEGIAAIKRTPGAAVFYGWEVGKYHLSPLLGYLLNLFEESVKQGKPKLNFDKLSENLKSTTSKRELRRIIGDMTTWSPSPIKEFSRSIIELSTDQYMVVSTVDFASMDEAQFVDRGVAAIPVFIGVKPVLIPPSAILEDLRKTALSSLGSEYEDMLTKALKSLKCGKVKLYGHKRPGKRISDILWRVPIIDSMSNSEKTLLVIVEAKAGDAVRQLDERIMMDDIRRTLAMHRRQLPKIAGIWIWVVDGQSLPASTRRHGGFRGTGGKSFVEKMQDLLSLMIFVNRLIIVTAMNIDSFIEYYTYLYGLLRQVSPPLNEITTPQFWTWGRLFRPISTYVFVYNDAREMKRQLFVPTPTKS